MILNTGKIISFILKMNKAFLLYSHNYKEIRSTINSLEIFILFV